MGRVSGGMVIAIVSLTCVRTWAEVDPPPHPPADWREKVTPGFAHSIEAAIIDITTNRPELLSSTDNTEFATYWDKWGEDAVPVVRDLYEDPRWSEFRDSALQLLVAAPFPRALTYLQFRIRWLARKERQDEQDFRELGMLYNALASNHPDVALTIVTELTGSDDWRPRSAVARAIVLTNAEEDLTALKGIVARLPEEDRERLARSVEFWESQSRAMEPMERVLLGRPGLSPYFAKTDQPLSPNKAAARPLRHESKPYNDGTAVDKEHLTAESQLQAWMEALRKRELNLEELQLPCDTNRNEIVRILVERVNAIDRYT